MKKDVINKEMPFGILHLCGLCRGYWADKDPISSCPRGCSLEGWAPKKQNPKIDKKVMKVFVVNKNKSFLIEKCGSAIIEIVEPDQKPVNFCPAFASCCEYGDVCQIEDKDAYEQNFINGFPEYCPLDDS